MSMLSEIAIEGIIKSAADEIKKELVLVKDKPEVCAALKKIGRFILTQFEWDTSDWAEEYTILFKE